MPSWITHFVTANRMRQKVAENEFIFANIMPDILEGYNVKKVSKIVKDYQSHYPTIKVINGITIPIPNINYFKKEYKNKMQNPIIKGYYCHLLTDYFWNVHTYKKYFQNYNKERRLVKIKLNNGNKQIMHWDDAVKIKQKDFRKFTNFLKNEQKIIMPVYSDQIKRYAEDIKEFEYTQEDIENTILFIQKMIHIEDEKQNIEYSIYTEKELINTLENSIRFIKKKLDE